MKEEMGEEIQIKYYRRKSGIIVRVIDDITLEYLNEECEWVPNQEWYIAMFIDGEDDYEEISEEYVNSVIKNKLNSTINVFESGPRKILK